MDPEQTSNTADAAAGPAPAAPLHAALLIPDRTNPLAAKTGHAKLGGRKFVTMCPPPLTWGKLGPWLNLAGELELPPPLTHEWARCAYTCGLFIGACLSSSDLACLKGAIRAGLVEDEEVIEAVRLALSLWWPAVGVALPID